MRDPARIAPMMNELAAIWRNEFPDLRFAQMIVNFISWLGFDPYYMEDDEFMKRFKEFVED